MFKCAGRNTVHMPFCYPHVYRKRKGEILSESTKNDTIKSKNEIPERKRSTPYDDVFRTVLTDCPRLIIPVINEMFGTDYSADVQVVLGQNEQFILEEDDEKQITDSNILLYDLGRLIGKYHIECQTIHDKSMAVRMFRYDIQSARSASEDGIRRTIVRISASGVILLRSRKRSPHEMNIQVVAPNGQMLEYSMPVLHVKDYSLEQMRDKKLWFLYPFYIFHYERKLTRYEHQEDLRREFCLHYEKIWQSLERDRSRGTLTSLETDCLEAMIRKAAEAFLQNYARLRKDVNEIMGGQVLDYETKRARREGRAEGITEGQAEDARQTAGRLFERGFSYEDVRAVVSQIITDDELRKLEQESKKKI
jgi:hypothetical protein